MAALPSLRAELIPLTNPSFENLTGNDPVHFDLEGKLRPGHYSSLQLPSTPAGFLAVNAIPGWASEASAGTGGTMAPLLGAAAGALFAAVPDGQNTIFLEGDGFSQQFLTRTYQANTRYVFSADVGRPRNVAPPPEGLGFALSLGAGFEPITLSQGQPIPAAGEFVRAEVAYSVVEGDPFIGQAITVGLLNSGPSAVHFDNVRLEAIPLAGPTAIISAAVQVKWESRKGEQYRVDRATRLQNPDWTPVVTGLVGTGEVMSLFEVAADQARYYRIVPVRP